MRRLVVLALVAATATLAPPAVAASRPALSHLWHVYPLGRTRLQTIPAPTTGPAATGRTTPAPGPGLSSPTRARRSRPGDSRRVTAVLASAAAAVSVVVIVVLGHRIGWVLRGARREPVAADGRRRILGADPTQVALFGFAAVTGVVVGILIPLIG